MNTVAAGALWALMLMCGVVGPVDGAPTVKEEHKHGLINLREEFTNSWNLCRWLVKESRSLTKSYKKWKLPGTYLDFVLKPQVPSVSIGASKQVKLQPGDRLQLLNEALRVFPPYLEKLERWESEEASVQDEAFGDKPRRLADCITRVRLDLRDLLRHIQLQMSSIGVKPSNPPTPETQPPHSSEWRQRVEMYHALRSLERVLTHALMEYTTLRLNQG